MLKIVQKTIVTVLLALGLPALIIVALSYWWWTTNSAPFDSDGQEISFAVHRGDTVSSVAKRLESQGVIRSELAFKIWHQLSGEEVVIQPGTFYLSQTMTFEEIAKTLAKSDLVVVKITFPEGLRLEEYQELLSKNLDSTFSVQDFNRLARPKEGSLFPDTYEFYKSESAENIVKKLTDNFEQKYALVNGPKSAQEKHKIITLASLVEKEGKTDEDRPVIAGILLNRIAGDNETAGLLQVDATLQYAKNEKRKTTQDWWPVPLPADKEIESKYNTYKYPGLPPGPIANPGLASIKAAINPAKTPYLYYVHDKNQKVYYAKNYTEHQQNIANYLL